MILDKQKDVPLSPSFTSLLAQDGIALSLRRRQQCKHYAAGRFGPTCGSGLPVNIRSWSAPDTEFFTAGLRTWVDRQTPVLTIRSPSIFRSATPTGTAGRSFMRMEARLPWKRALCPFTPDPIVPTLSRAAWEQRFSGTPKRPIPSNGMAPCNTRLSANSKRDGLLCGERYAAHVEHQQAKRHRPILPPGTDFTQFIAYPHFSPNMDYIPRTVTLTTTRRNWPTNMYSATA